MTARIDHIQEAQQLMRSQKHGVLSTHSVAVPGFPFGSVVPYCLDGEGRPILLISDIAQHTKNIQGNPKVSLTILNHQENDVQASGRVTYLAEAHTVTSGVETLGERYYRFFPESRGYHNTHDFEFYRLEPVKIRYIGGFGKIYWFTTEEFQDPTPFSFEDEQGILTHMNDDHQKALRHYFHAFQGKRLEDSHRVQMVGIDGHGFDVHYADRLWRFEFETAITNKGQARKVLTAMAKVEV